MQQIPRMLVPLLLTLLCITTSLFSATLSVGPAPSPFRTIQEAVRAAQSGDTIEIAPGTYVENIRFQKALHLKGLDRKKTLIRPANPGIPTIWIENSTKAIVESLSIEGGTIAISLAMSNADILSNTIQSQGDGIRAGSFDHVLLISNNVISGSLTRAEMDTVQSNGLFLVGRGKAQIQFNEIRNFGCGLFSSGKKPCSVERNVFVANSRGIYSVGLTEATITYNSFRQNYKDALLLASKSILTITHNSFEQNDGYDIRAAVGSCNAGTGQLFSGKVFGEGNQVESLRKVCPSDTLWPEGFFVLPGTKLP
ncbi:MAG TPA: right-handed parallel beta-helix repeat-containing protein [Thermotogota bacterium]|nr:right-handed parallel beta-helix repeat-containing protein [Thermotogota bacterium]